MCLWKGGCGWGVRRWGVLGGGLTFRGHQLVGEAVADGWGKCCYNSGRTSTCFYPWPFPGMSARRALDEFRMSNPAFVKWFCFKSSTIMSRVRKGKGQLESFQQKFIQKLSIHYYCIKKEKGGWGGGSKTGLCQVNPYSYLNAVSQLCGSKRITAQKWSFGANQALWGC